MRLKLIAQLSALMSALCLLPACSAATKRVDAMNQPPAMAALMDPNMAMFGGQPVMMPTSDRAPRGDARAAALRTNSLWQESANTFFGDPRAGQRGDILTVEINISDQASLSNSTSQDRSTSANLGITAFFGIPQLFRRASPTTFDETAPVGVSSSSNFTGDGAIDRSETIRLTVAATVVQVLPNGNFIIAGGQDVQINHEVRRLTITGVVRPQDITAANTIPHTKIAEARIAYGGQGVMSGAQKPGFLTQAYGAVAPF